MLGVIVMRVLIVQNDEIEDLGLYVDYLVEKNIDHKIFHAYDMDVRSFFPSFNDYDAFIIGPTPISANYLEEYKFLRKEWNFLGKIIGSRKPVLGVCCGGQMLAKRLGALIVTSPQKEVGGYEVSLTEIGKRDPLFKGFPNSFPVFQWHSEMFYVPQGGGLLV